MRYSPCRSCRCLILSHRLVLGEGRSPAGSWRCGGGTARHARACSAGAPTVVADSRGLRCRPTRAHLLVDVPGYPPAAGTLRMRIHSIAGQSLGRPRLLDRDQRQPMTTALLAAVRSSRNRGQALERPGRARAGDLVQKVSPLGVGDARVGQIPCGEQRGEVGLVGDVGASSARPGTVAESQALPARRDVVGFRSSRISCWRASRLVKKGRMTCWCSADSTPTGCSASRSRASRSWS